MTLPVTPAVAAIQKAALARGLNPAPLIAVAHYESGLNPRALGDGGHAFGLFQNNNAGGTITGDANPTRFYDPNVSAQYAARAIAGLHIQGMTPQQQVAAIVNRYERPAKPGPEIAGALSFYQQELAGGLPQTSLPKPIGKPKPGPAGALNTPTAPTSRYSAQDIAALQGLLGQRQASQQSAQDALGAISGDARGVANPIDLTPYLDRGQPPAGRPTPAKPPAAPPTKPAPTTPTRTKGGYTVGTFEGTKVASWMVPALAYARANGWTGKVLSGLRSTALQAQLYAKYQAGGNIAAKPGQSNHEIQNGGAFDASDPTQLNKILAGYKGQRPIYAPTVGLNDSAHFSLTGR